MCVQNALVAYYKARQATPEMKALWKDGIYFVNKLKVTIIKSCLLTKQLGIAEVKLCLEI